MKLLSDYFIVADSYTSTPATKTSSETETTTPAPGERATTKPATAETALSKPGLPAPKPA